MYRFCILVGCDVAIGVSVSGLVLGFDASCVFGGGLVP